MTIIFFLIAILLVVADQVLKAFVRGNIDFGSIHTFIPGVLSITNIDNTGGAWSILSGNMIFFYLVTIIAVIILLTLIFKAKKNALFYRSGLILLLAGTIGNAIDRFTNQAVTDMFHVDFMNFAIFNLADVYITFGVIIIIIHLLFFEKGDN